MNRIADDRDLRGMRTSLWLCAPLLMLATACDSAIVDEAQRAEDQGAVVSNEAMTSMYPETFRPGSPAYLERDFEAGANFICDEIKTKHGRDICSEPDINWR
ncbi:hypothetical protein [Sphingopyxis sp. JAI128]|uniref:hypothetical protein n=1 Tax=Sphingopyxis sp. JAI128 TaxID=2723066 RepID=UPI00161A8E72|nr:hypothetical protein [Sphingopyxis sp. JAI128]MBB6425156.1 hypothetical protein [Sphingopyxis sp. JAI128]